MWSLQIARARRKARAQSHVGTVVAGGGCGRSTKARYGTQHSFGAPALAMEANANTKTIVFDHSDPISWPHDSSSRQNDSLYHAYKNI
jgi:hypothetical protein